MKWNNLFFFPSLHAAAAEIVAFSNDINVLEGNDAILTCNATSEPTHIVQWLKDGMPLNLTEKYSVSNFSQGIDEREVISTLIVFNSNMLDTGNYTCEVSNIHGNQSATAHVEVQSELVTRSLFVVILSVCMYAIMGNDAISGLFPITLISFACFLACSNPKNTSEPQQHHRVICKYQCIVLLCFWLTNSQY